ncbi:MAG: peptide chain release factor-like protein [Gemmataceae bacterium]
MTMAREEWALLSNSELMRQCEVDTYRASGPGGQKRNKTSSAVRLRHTPSGLLVIAEESRSQHENREKAIQRLRESFYLNIRHEVDPKSANLPDVLQAYDLVGIFGNQGKLKFNKKNPKFWPTVGFVLDVLHAYEARVSDAAKFLGISTGNLIDFLQTSPKVWEQTNAIRTDFGQKTLKNT